MKTKMCVTCDYYEPRNGVCCNGESEYNMCDTDSEDGCDAWTLLHYEAAERMIKERLPRTELLAGLAEKASGLAQAALKLRQVLNGSNPTTVAEKQAVDNLIEELGGVLCCAEAVITPEQVDQVKEVCACKRARWARRLWYERARKVTT